VAAVSRAPWAAVEQGIHRKLGGEQECQREGLAGTGGHTTHREHLVEIEKHNPSHANCLLTHFG
jgi:hypothetical protein